MKQKCNAVNDQETEFILLFLDINIYLLLFKNFAIIRLTSQPVSIKILIKTKFRAVLHFKQYKKKIGKR